MDPQVQHELCEVQHRLCEPQHELCVVQLRLCLYFLVFCKNHELSTAYPQVLHRFFHSFYCFFSRCIRVRYFSSDFFLFMPFFCDFHRFIPDEPQHRLCLFRFSFVVKTDIIVTLIVAYTPPVRDRWGIFCRMTQPQAMQTNVRPASRNAVVTGPFAA